MSQNRDGLPSVPMSPRELSDSEQVAPGRYVSKDRQRERDVYNFAEEDFFTWTLHPSIAEESLAVAGDHVYFCLFTACSLCCRLCFSIRRHGFE